MNQQRRLPAEWERQSFVQIAWPDELTDWESILGEVAEFYRNVAREISRREPLLIVTRDEQKTRRQLADIDTQNIRFAQMPINDTWARDHAFITVIDGQDKPVMIDYQFNGWGLKFASDKDNLINSQLFKTRFAAQEGCKYHNRLSTVLEGGSIESDGQGTILTTSQCLLSPNRNGEHTQRDIENFLCEDFGAQRVLWLNNGYLAGDDTDSHIDTLARFAPNDTILYIGCADESDPHFAALRLMEQELQQLRTANGEPYTLVKLPMCQAVYDKDNGDRLPATYANFLYVNGAVLVPTYNTPQDDEALAIFRRVFPDREIVGIDCSPLIRQHGSLHCITMQYPEQVKLL